MKRTGSTTSIVIATIAGLSVLGIAGYRMMSGDCGACAVTGNEVTTTAVATEGDCGSCCALMEGAKETEATLVSTGESCESSCSDKGSCSGDAAQVEMISTTGESCESSCSDKGSCSGDAAQVEMISTEAGSDCADACGDACAGDACGTDADACCGKCEAGKELAKAPQ